MLYGKKRECVCCLQKNRAKIEAREWNGGLLLLFFSAQKWPLQLAIYTHTIAVGNGHRRGAITACQVKHIKCKCLHCSFSDNLCSSRSSAFNFRNLSRYQTLSHLSGRGDKVADSHFPLTANKVGSFLSVRVLVSLSVSSVWWSRKASTSRRGCKWLSTSDRRAVRGRRLTSHSVSQTTKAKVRTSWECGWWWRLNCMNAIELDSVSLPAKKKLLLLTLGKTMRKEWQQFSDTIVHTSSFPFSSSQRLLVNWILSFCTFTPLISKYSFLLSRIHMWS